MESAETEKELYDELFERIKKNESIANLCREFSSVWSELYDEEERRKRHSILAKNLEEEIYNFLEKVANEEKEVRDDYIEGIENLLSEINDLQKDLEIAIPYDDVENLPLHNMAFHLNKKAEKYRNIKNEKIAKLNELLKREAEMCKTLDMMPSDMKYSPIPSDTELKQLENHIAAMEQEITNRTLTLQEQSQKIASLFRELDVKPILNFDKEILSQETHENFILSNENMKRLQELLARVQGEVDDAKQTVQELWQKLNVLWDYLDEPEEHRKLFVEAHSGHSIPTINALKEELNRCDKKKRENISKIISKMRQVLTEEWDRCLISKDERQKFRPFTIDCFTQDLCELHEFEIERLRNFYENNEQIFNLIIKHEKLFQKLIDLENVSKNANRYYNRGGRLLQEERQRKAITKELPIVEEELRNLLQKYEKDHGKPFTSFGVPMLLVLDEQWNAHFDQKTIEKNERKKGGEKKLKTPLGKRPVTTPGSSVVSKMLKLNSEKVVSSTTKCNSLKKTSRVVKATKLSSEDHQPDTTYTFDSTYDKFQSDLQAKIESAKKGIKAAVQSTSVKECSSATTPSRPVLREKNTPITLSSQTAAIKSAPENVCSTPNCASSIRKTPKTLPAANRRQKQATRLTPAVNRLPLII